MNENRRKIFHFVQKLQSQTEIPIWKLANEKVCYSAAIGEKVKWGSKVKLLRMILSVAHKLNIADCIILALGCYRSISIWWRVRIQSFVLEKETGFTKIFAGFGASSEEHLYTSCTNDSNNKILRIDWATYSGISKLGCPSLFRTIVFVLKNTFGYTAKLKNNIPEISHNIVEFATAYALNLGIYSFYRSFWKLAKLKGVNEAIVLAVDTPAYACVNEGIRTTYLQHGLMALSIPIPKLHCVNVLTPDEEKFLKLNIKNIEINRNISTPQNKTKNNFLMILSINVKVIERLSSCESLIGWALKKGLKIIIRSTPSVTPEQLGFLQEKIPGAIFDDISIDFKFSLDKWRPKFVAAWTSTALATALELGYLPITLYEFTDPIWDNIIYPMKNRILFWPRDEKLIEKVFETDVGYNQQITKLLSYKEVDFNIYENTQF